MDTNINLNFTLNEAQVLIQLIDIAVKTQGLRAAEAGVFLVKKIVQKINETNGNSQQLNSFQAPQSFNGVS